MHGGSCGAKQAEGMLVEGGGRVVSLHKSVHTSPRGGQHSLRKLGLQEELPEGSDRLR